MIHDFMLNIMLNNANRSILILINIFNNQPMN